MKKTISILLMICTLTLCLVSCGHEHEWSNATYENPKTCSSCGEKEGDSIKDMLLGEWCEEGSTNIYLCITFTSDGFTADGVIDGNMSGGYFARRGTVEVVDNIINLYETNGQKYIYFTYTIEANTIKLIDYEGNTWVKRNN